MEQFQTFSAKAVVTVVDLSKEKASGQLLTNVVLATLLLAAQLWDVPLLVRETESVLRYVSFVERVLVCQLVRFRLTEESG
jgi:hypothetical protein